MRLYQPGDTWEVPGEKRWSEPARHAALETGREGSRKGKDREERAACAIINLPL